MLKAMFILFTLTTYSANNPAGPVKLFRPVNALYAKHDDVYTLKSAVDSNLLAFNQVIME